MKEPATDPAPILPIPLVPVMLWVENDDSTPTGCLGNIVTDSFVLLAPMTEGLLNEDCGILRLEDTLRGSWRKELYKNEIKPVNDYRQLSQVHCGLRVYSVQWNLQKIV